ncbi:MAG: hypothetical protein K2X70_08435, partial [Candidatus Obscuribacterales bacterium]|nr:hypothetical protein [Candidatus Obscuribacterales bacterium]
SPIATAANAKDAVPPTPTALIGNAKDATTLLSNLSSATGFRQNEINTAASQQTPARELAASALTHTSTTAISHNATSTIRDISPTTASTLKSLETLTNGLLEPPVATAKIAELTVGQVNGQKMFFTELAPTAAKDQSAKPESKTSSAAENLLPIKTFTIKTNSSTETTIEGKVIKPTTTATITSATASTTGAISPANVITESEHGKDKDPLPALTLVDSKGENGKADGKTEDKKEDKTSKEKDDETIIKQLTEKERAQKEQDERDQAYKAMLDAAKKKAQTTGPNTQQYDPDKRRVHVIQQGETLASIAAKVLGDATLADLIYKINEGLWASKASHDKRSIRLEFAPGTTIFLPTRKEIADYRKQQRARLHEQIRFEYAPRSNSKGLRQALAENRVPPVQVKRQFESDITSDTDALEADSRIRMEILHGSDGKQYVSHRLEHFDLGDWQTVVEYRAGEESMLRTISRSGKERKVPLDLPTDVVDSMAISDLTNNRVRYLQRYLAGKRLYC